MKKPITRREFAQSMNYYAASFGKPTEEVTDVTLDRATKEKNNKSDPSQLEAAVTKEIAEVLASHPNVLFAVRQNSGSAEFRGVPIWFYRWARRRGIEMTLTDYWGCLTDGRMFAIEAKRRNWTKVSDKREQMQQAFIDVVRSAGGVGAFATCAEDAIKCLDGVAAR